MERTAFMLLSDCNVWHFNKQPRKINGLCTVCSGVQRGRNFKTYFTNLIHHSTNFFFRVFFTHECLLNVWSLFSLLCGASSMFFSSFLLSIYFRCPCTILAFFCQFFFPSPRDIRGKNDNINISWLYIKV